MLNANHPDEERLSALASNDADVAADRSLTVHVSTCDRCAELVAELGALRSALADLPDLQPARPLRILPAADEPVPRDGFAAWVQRLFTPALTAGAVIAVVGLIGTAAPSMTQTIFSNVGNQLADGDSSRGGQSAAPAEGAAGGEAEAPGSIETLSSDDAANPDEPTDAATDGDGPGTSSLPAERSPWPMVLFTGVALMVGIALLRWIVVPRAG